MQSNNNITRPEPLKFVVCKPYTSNERLEMVANFCKEHEPKVRALRTFVVEGTTTEKQIERAAELFLIPDPQPYFLEEPNIEYAPIRDAIEKLKNAAFYEDSISLEEDLVRKVAKAGIDFAANIVLRAPETEEQQQVLLTLKNAGRKVKFEAFFEFDTALEREWFDFGLSRLFERFNEFKAYNDYDKWWCLVNGVPKVPSIVPKNERRGGRRDRKAKAIHD